MLILNVTVTHVIKCACGAITLIFDNGASNSMYLDTFNKLSIDTSKAKHLPDSYCCNHCVNHWGIDLCQCGSGLRVEECECQSNIAHDELGIAFDSLTAIINAFNH